MRNPVIAICGTTGVGKTKLSLELGKVLNGEIINIDAMQMYRGYDIITNKATLEERRSVKHHLIDFCQVDQEYTIKDFEVDALKKIDELHNKGKIPILVGGTHYYLQSLLWSSTILSVSDKKNSSVDLTSQREKWDKLTNEQLHRALEEVDPKLAQRWHVNDRRKVYRGLEIFYSSGLPQSQWILENQEKDKKLKFNTIILWLYAKEEILARRLDSRVDVMVQQGLFGELTKLRNCLDNLPGDNDSYERGIKQAIGFKAFHHYLDLIDQNETDSDLVESERLKGLELMKQQTRKYAKKQVHWIRNQMLPLYYRSSKSELDHKAKLYVLNATDVDNWQANVGDKAMSIVKELLNGSEGPDPQSITELSSSLLVAPDTLPKADQLATWKKRVCEVCSLRINRQTKQLVPTVVINGDREWDIHVQSKGHRNMVSFVKKRSLIKIDIETKKGMPKVHPSEESDGSETYESLF